LKQYPKAAALPLLEEIRMNAAGTAQDASDRMFVSEDQFDSECDARFLHHGGTGCLAAMNKGPCGKLLAHAKSQDDDHI